MKILTHIAAGGVLFGKNVYGVATKPYETYRSIVEKSSWWELAYLAIVLASYFALASLVRTAAFRPYLLTRQFMYLGMAAGISYIVIIATLYIAAKAVGGRGTLKGLSIGWAYTLLPTVSWFLGTSILYVLLPPPRTASVPGMLFSFLYLVFSVVLLFWKVTLAYLTLRFSMKLDLVRIGAVTAISAPFLAVYSFLMYRWGIFRIPFI